MLKMLNLYRSGLLLLKQIPKPALRYYSEKIVPLNETTLIGRMVLFMNNEYNKNINQISQIDSNIIDKIKSNRTNLITTLKFEQLEELLRSLKYQDFISNIRHFQRLINVIDLECCSRLNDLDSQSVLRLLNVFTQSVPNRVTETKYYNEALKYLNDYIDYLSKEELLQTIFYVGLQKKMKNAQRMLRNCLKRFHKEDIQGLSIEELCIICNSTFKTSTKISNHAILEKIVATIEDKLYLLKDPALFVTLLKTIRHNIYQDDNLLSTISCTVLFNKTYKYYNFPMICHILALYADYQYYDEELLKLFAELATELLEESQIVSNSNFIADRIRPKDITRFLWSLSLLGFKIDGKLIIAKITEAVEAGVYKKEMEELVNSLLYLWMFDHQATDLIKTVLTRDTVEMIRDTKSKTKLRLNLLLTCIFFENKALFHELNVKAQRVQPFNTELQLERRPKLIKVLNTLRKISSNINKFEITYEIPHLNICGITGYSKSIYKTVYVEVLDEYVRVKNHRNQIIGPMQLKLRILREKDEALIVISDDAIDEMCEGELEEYLKSEIDLLC